MKNKNFAFIILISILLFSTLACNFGFQNGNISMTITLKRENLMQLINSAQGIAGSVSESELLIEVQDVQFLEPDKVQADWFLWASKFRACEWRN